MDKDLIARLARDAGFAPEQGTAHTDRMFQRFAQLVAEELTSACVDRCVEFADAREASVRAAVAEECAKMAEDPAKCLKMIHGRGGPNQSEWVAQAIRARFCGVDEWLLKRPDE